MRIHPERGARRAPSRTVFLPRIQQVGLALLAAAAVHAGGAAAAADPGAASRFQVFGAGQRFKPANLPLGARQNERVTVVVQMSADPVAAVRAQAPDHQITRAQHDTIAAQIAQQHAAIEPEITGRGGRVLAHFHDAINGVKVQIPRDQIEALKSAPGVIDVLPVRTYHHNNAQSVPFIGAPLVWQATPGFRGEGVKIAVIDTGIDYTHANFGGPGTVDAFKKAAASSTQPADPKLFGPAAPKVKGGTDLVGDAYDANDPTSVPQPDPNPLDCDGHGSHTAGTAAGFGVAADGTTYKGPYDSAAYSQNFVIGPGVAPKADLYAVRVFGCSGSTNVVVDGIDWAIHNGMDVISMSLGSDFGTAQDADAVAATNATRAGILVAAASGNSGPVPYITSTPAVSSEAISVAAIDSHASFPGAAVSLNDGSIEAQDSNGAGLPAGALGVVVLKTSTGAVSLGCDESEYANGNVAGKLVVTQRGTCARVLRAQLGQKYNAAAVAMINTSAGYPPYEGPISGVTIPFLGVLASDAATLGAATTASSFTSNTIANPTYRTAASFSSGGPRFGDSVLKPNVSAPGVSIFSTAVGTGNGGVYESGTSMATPHIAGVAALAKQAHPKWSEAAISAAVVETADPKQLTDYTTSLEGSGLVQPVGATRTQAVVFAGTSGGEHALSFGFDEFLWNFHTERELLVHNYGDSTIVFNVTSTAASAVPHTLHFTHSVTVRPHSDAELEVSLSVPVGTVGATHDANGNDLFEEVGGYLTFTPATSGMNGGVTLNVPYYMVPRARSDVFALLTGNLSAWHPKANVLLANVLGGITGNGDFYAWGLGTNKPQGLKHYDTRAVGVQSNPVSATDSLLVFAINTFKRFSSAEGGEFDVLIDVNGDGKPDFDLVAIDMGLLSQPQSFTGQYVAALVDLTTKSATINFLADAPTDGSTILVPVLASSLGLSPSNPRFTYTETTYDLLDNTSASLPGSASFNAFAPAISNALFVPVAPNKTASVPVAINPTEWAKTPALGLMVVVQDNTSGERQANLLPVRH
jgi:subtilisin family serine protease